MFTIRAKTVFFAEQFLENFFFADPDLKQIWRSCEPAAGEEKIGYFALKCDRKRPKIRSFETLRRLFFSDPKTFFFAEKKSAPPKKKVPLC